MEKKVIANDPKHTTSSVKHLVEVVSWHGHALLSLEQGLSTLLMT